MAIFTLIKFIKFKICPYMNICDILIKNLKNVLYSIYTHISNACIRIHVQKVDLLLRSF